MARRHLDHSDVAVISTNFSVGKGGLKQLEGVCLALKARYAPTDTSFVPAFKSGARL